jgi:hypothetical protein
MLSTVEDEDIAGRNIMGWSTLVPESKHRAGERKKPTPRIRKIKD